MISDQEMGRIKRRCSRASTGPWEYLQVRSDFGHCIRHGIQHVKGGSVVLFSHPITNMKSSYDENFIAHSRTDIPKLLEEIKRLKEQNKRLKRKNM